MRNEYRVVTFCQKSSEFFGPEPGAVSSQYLSFTFMTPPLPAERPPATDQGCGP